MPLSKALAFTSTATLWVLHDKTGKKRPSPRTRASSLMPQAYLWPNPYP
jgi:hypothetical protein